MRKYANEIGWSEVYPYEVVRAISPITLEIRQMDTERHPDWHPDFIPTGFAGHCTNQSEQKWIYKSNPDHPCIRIRHSKNGGWVHKGRKFRLADEPCYFHDYNF